MYVRPLIGSFGKELTSLTSFSKAAGCLLKRSDGAGDVASCPHYHHTPEHTGEEENQKRGIEHTVLYGRVQLLTGYIRAKQRKGLAVRGAQRQTTGIKTSEI